MIVCANRSGGKDRYRRIGAWSTRAPLAQITNPLTETRQGLICGPHILTSLKHRVYEWLIILDCCCEAYLRATVE